MRLTLGDGAVEHIQKRGGKAAVDLLSFSS